MSVVIGMYLLYSDGVYLYSNALTHIASYIASYKLYIRHSDFESRVTFIRPFPINPSDRDMGSDRGILRSIMECNRHLTLIKLEPSTHVT